MGDKSLVVEVVDEVAIVVAVWEISPEVSVSFSISSCRV